MLKKSRLNKVLKIIKKNRSNYYSGELNNVIFLDFDGVLNLDTNNYTDNFDCKVQIQNLNKFCIEQNFKIVVSSSWRKYSNYKDILYKSGLNSNIKILGATKILEADRETEILDYLENHTNISRFIILDDGDFNELSKFQVKTVFSKGFDNSKYQEALNLINCINFHYLN